MSDVKVNITPTVVTLREVVFSWPQTSSPVLHIPELTIGQGEHVFIKGPSGCGKSTLLGLLTGIHQAQHGVVEILGTDISQLTASQRDTYRADHIGYIFQQFNLLPYLNVVENVILPCHFSKQRKQRLTMSADETARQLLRRLHLPDGQFNKAVVALSIGQQQRVAAARALIGAPALIIADEPTSALDHENRHAFIQLLMEQANAAQSTLIFVSHDPTLEPLFDRVIDLQRLNHVERVS
ncbi:ABC transporter ATP-binding protein [Photobacterium japonica]|uniref:ABC transporter ATP-binding protein n=1 Tax=Photobacterium japonica TaxID=2910235 RepID=UPI003D0CC067